MGYDIDLFENKSIEEDFICPICQDVLEEPSVLPECEHIFCKSCIDNWRRDNSTCPQCRSSITNQQLQTPQRYFRNKLNSLKLKCCICDEFILFEVYDNHQKKCTIDEVILDARQSSPSVHHCQGFNKNEVYDIISTCKKIINDKTNKTYHNISKQVTDFAFNKFKFNVITKVDDATIHSTNGLFDKKILVNFGRLNVMIYASNEMPNKTTEKIEKERQRLQENRESENIIRVTHKKATYENNSPKDYYLDEFQLKFASADSKKLEKERIQKKKAEKIRILIKEISSNMSIYSEISIKKIEKLLGYYDKIINNQDCENFDLTIDVMRDLSLNEISIVGLKMCNLIKNHLNKVINYLSPVFNKILVLIRDKQVCRFEDSEIDIDNTVIMPKILLEHFEGVRIKDDGNCLWHSISVSLFGDYSMMESLSLVTVGILIKYEDYFKRQLEEQKSKYAFSHKFNFEQLLKASFDCGTCGDEFHLFALSIGLRRPIYSYGSFKSLNTYASFSYSSSKFFEKFKHIYENTSLSFVCFEEDEEKEPICIYYNGGDHYSVIMPRKSCGIKPITPFAKLFDYIKS